ncbi:uncharacterized protein METZ01_LOCUS495173, partial [marine metagenome]
MKHLLLTTIAALVLVGCGESQESFSPATGHQLTSLSKADRTLIKAAKIGSIQDIRHSLSEGANVNAKDNLGRCALYFAAEKNHKEIAELLIAEGADVNSENSGGQTPLYAAAWQGHEELIDLFRKHGGKSKLELPDKKPIVDKRIIDAAQKGNIRFIKIRLADTVFPVDLNNTKDQFGMTALDWAAQRGYKEIAELLIASGADVNERHEFSGNTPLNWAL